MKVELNLYASLRRYGPDNATNPGPWLLEAKEGTTITELLKCLNVPLETVRLIFLNGVHTNGHEILNDGDKVGVFPPIAGG